ncbi:MAG: STE24 endopeptidase [Brevundimonas sp.]|jgi:STE24 endopeptidase|uniref:M48 family metallopeptidase n=1 Tax=Brevundimonas sp. GW460-12-10-14-LB2 TaxID=1827469 RepID=UPI0007BC9E06|nr:M48 family metallopeptidase [Brevundimonas sp. GW460-12-10-14-LB2]ANC52378.1 peptidase M48 [Brevundimonas sp. GW460-12-10-14-LB2]MEA3472651.1 M48 family metallopeptidase [Pseudomonadota bacterium]
MTNFDPAAATAQWLATLSPQETARAIAYTHGSHWLILWSFLVSALVAWIIVRTGLLVAIRSRIERRRRRPILASFVVALVYSAMSWALTLPWAIYQGWWREKQYGLTSQALGGWLGEAVIGAAISVVATSLLLVAIYALIRRARRFWWAWAAGVTAAFIVIGLVLAPLVIEPIFNTYTPAPNGPVRDAVVTLAKQTGTPSDKIFIYNGSKQSDRYTANVSGLFGTARVAMSDTMFKQGADLAEVRGVVGHEMGHYVRAHILWTVGILVLLSVLAFWLTDRLYPVAHRVLRADRVGDISDPAGLPVLALVLAFLGVLGTPVFATMTRTMEEDADHFSLVHANEPDGLSKALIKTAEYRAPSPSAIEEFLFYDHPSVENRIRRAMEWKATHPPRDGAQQPTRP